MRTTILAGLLLLPLLSACAGGAAAEGPASTYSAAQYAGALSHAARADDREADAARLPGELLAFAQIDRGEVVGDFIMGGGYVTRLLAGAVGEEGRVYAFQPVEFIAFRAEYAAEQDRTIARYAGADGQPLRVFPLRGPVAHPGWPEPLDTVITVMNLHDLFIPQMPAGTSQAAIADLYAALRPGGTLVVIDHLAADGGGLAAADRLHRMDRELALTALTSAGFVLEAESDLYARPDDPRTANVFDQAIRGRTDQLAWRLRKPE